MEKRMTDVELATGIAYLRDASGKRDKIKYRLAELESLVKEYGQLNSDLIDLDYDGPGRTRIREIRYNVAFELVQREIEGKKNV